MIEDHRTKGMKRQAASWRHLKTKSKATLPIRTARSNIIRSFPIEKIGQPQNAQFCREKATAVRRGR